MSWISEVLNKGVSKIGLRLCSLDSAHLIHFLIISDLHTSQDYFEGCTYFGPSLPEEKKYLLSLNNVISVHFTELQLLWSSQ
jgi:hypothetical protein